MLRTAIPLELPANYQSLIEAHIAKYGIRPSFLARAPGRVNLIGEHIDYEGYGVLPAAIMKECIMTVSLCQASPNQQPVVSIYHTDCELFPSCTIRVNHPIDDLSGPTKYVKYFLAGYKAGIIGAQSTLQGYNLNITMTGNIPIAAGLSSSSALCVCSALVASHTYQLLDTMPPETFVSRCIEAQRLVGTASGGMDQSISVLGKKDTCLKIDFNPIRVANVPLPAGYSLVIMNSLVQSAKLDTAVYRYNKRVCECRLAAHLLSRNLKLNPNNQSWQTLKHVQDFVQLPLSEMALLVTSFIPQTPLSQQALQAQLGQPLHSILADIPLYKEVLVANKTFNLYEAAYHVYTEAQRVNSFVRVCSSTNLPVDKKAIILGSLMNDSQFSCSQLYKCSCVELDELTSTARKLGALGSRLTGAGWGGCTVSLVKTEQVATFIKRMKETYYQPRGLTPINDEIIFQSRPGDGAEVIELIF